MAEHRIPLSIAGLTLLVIDDTPDVPEWLSRACAPFAVPRESRDSRDFRASGDGAGAVPAGAEPPAGTTIRVHRDASFVRANDQLSWRAGEAPGGFLLQGFDFSARRLECEAPIDVDAHPEAGMGGLLRWLVSLLLAERGGLLIHGASCSADGAGYLFAGPSGHGKTTLARLIQPRCALFTDETTAVRFLGEQPMIYATPFAGELGPVSGPASAPLETAFWLTHGAAAGAFLDTGTPAPMRGPSHDVRPLRASEAAARLAACAFLPVREPVWLAACLAIAECIARAVPCFDLSFTPTSDVWDVIQAAADHARADATA